MTVIVVLDITSKETRKQRYETYAKKVVAIQKYLRTRKSSFFSI